jgi:CRP/FNR family transcriptional regulator
MLNVTAPAAFPHVASRPCAAPQGAPQRRPAAADAGPEASSEVISDMLRHLSRSGLPLRRRLVHAGDLVYRGGDAFGELHVVHSGYFKIVATTADGREQLVGLHFRGDWLGFDGIASGRYGCDAIALDVGEVWSLSYGALLATAATNPGLLAVLHGAMSREMARERESLLSLCTLSVDARVADFLRRWVEALDKRGLRTDHITLCLSRAEIGNFLGMTLESVSRALSKLARARVIGFAEKGRRQVCIPDPRALGAYIERSLLPEAATLQ